MYIFMDYVLFVEFVGYLSLMTEALLGFPQLVKNFNNKSTIGMSLTMVLLWTGGDLFQDWLLFPKTEFPNSLSFVEYFKYQSTWLS